MTIRTALLCGALIAAGACGGRSAEREPAPAPPPPQLAERAVMVLPLQSAGGLAPGDLDAEIAYWLTTRGSRVDWVFPDDLERILARSPALDVRPGALAVGGIEWTEVERIGAPLYGDLRRLGAVSDARLALVPIAAGRATDGADGGRVTIAAALIDSFGGTVLWFGRVDGQPGADAGHRASAAVAAQALARALFP